MAGNVDTRILELQFENKDFEKNIAKSTKSIEELKEAMDFEETSSGIEKLAKGFSELDITSKISDNLQKLADKFTGLGNAGEYVLSRIRAGIESAALQMEQFIRSISIDQIPVGQGKYDALNKAVQTIIAGGKYTEDEAYGVMNRVMTYTSQTSHSFETMVSQISTMQSLGMGLPEAELFLEGVANASTKAGGDATKAANAMGILSKAYSFGYLGLQQFQSLSSSAQVVTEEWRKGILEAAVTVGDLEKAADGSYKTAKKYGKQVAVTFDNLENSLNKKWLTKATLKEFYKNYQFATEAMVDETGTMRDAEWWLAHPDEAVDSLGKTAYLTGQKALTLADALNAIKESVSSGWMTSMRLIFGDVTEAAEHFTNICDRIIESLEKIADFRNRILSAWSESGGRISLMQLLLGSYEEDAEEGAVGLLDLLDGLGKLIFDGFVDFMTIFAGEDEKNLMKNPDYFVAWLAVKAKEMTQNVQDFMNSIKTFFNEDIEVNGKTTTRLNIIHDIVDGIVAALALGKMVLDGVTGFILDIATQLGPSFDEITGFFGDLGASLYDTANAESTAQKIKKFFDDLGATLTPVTTGINDVIKSITDLLRTIFGLDEETEGKGTETADKIGNLVIGIFDIVGKVFGPMLEFIASVINLLDTLLEKGINAESLSEFGAGLGQAVKDMMKSFADSLPEGLTFFGDWIRDLFGLWDEGSEEAETRGNTFFSFLHRLFTEGFSSFDDFLSSLLGGFDLKTSLESGLGFGSAFNFLNTVMGWFKGTNLYNVILAFLGVAAVGTLVNLIHQAGKAVKTIGGFFDDVGGNLKAGITGKYEWFSEKLVNFAKAIGILVAAVVVLGSMNTASLIKGIIALGIVILLFVGLFSVINKQSEQLTRQAAIVGLMDSLAISIAAMCVGLAILSLALLPLANDTGKTIRALLLLAGMLTILGVFITVMMNTLDKFTFAAGGKEGGGVNQWAGIGKMAAMMLVLGLGMVLITTAVGALSVAIAPLAALGWEAMFRALILVGGMLAMFGIFITVMIKQMDELAFTLSGSNGMAGIGKAAAMLLVVTGSMALLAGSLALLVLAITPLSLLGWDGLLKALGGLGVLMLELYGFMKLMQKVTAGDKSASVKIAGFAGFAIAIGILVMAIIPLGLMPIENLGKALGGLAVIFAEIIGFMWLFKKAGVSTKALKFDGIIGFVAAIGILIFSLQPLANMSLGGFIQAIVGLGLVLLEIIGFMELFKVLGLSTKALNFTGIIGFTAALAILMFSLKPLSEMSPQGYQQAIFGLAAVMLELIVFMAIVKEVKPDVSDAAATLLMLVGLGVAMVLFGIAFNEVKDVPWETMLAFAGALSALIIAIAGGTKLAEGASLKGVIVLAAAIAAVLGVIALMAPVVITSVSGGLRKAAGDLSIFAQLIAVFANKMGGADEGSFDKAKRIIGKLNDLIFGMIGMTFMTGSISSFTRIMSMLTLAADEIIKFKDRIITAGPDGGTVIARFIIGQFKSLFENDLSGFEAYYGKADAFYSAVYKLGSAFDYFDSMTATAGDPSENNGLKLIKELAGCASDLDTIYNMDLERLQKQLAGLGGAMIIYAQGAAAVSGDGAITEDTDIGGAVTLLQKVSSSLAESGGFTIPENMPSDTELSDFGVQLAALAGALVAFEEAGSGLGDGTAEALRTLEFFKDLKAELALQETFGADLSQTINAFKDENGQLIQKDELTTFGEDIAQLGSSMAHFAASTQNVDEQTGEIEPIDFTKATDALTAIAEIPSKLPAISGLPTIIQGKRQSLTDFATELNLLGDAIGEFNTSTTTYDENASTVVPMDFTNVISFLNSIGDLQTKLPTVKGFSYNNLFNGTQQTLGDLGSEVAQLGAGLATFGEVVLGTGGEEGGVSPSEAFKPENTKPVMDLVDQMIDFMEKIAIKLPKVGGLGDIISTAFSGRSSTLKDVGDAIGEMGDGLSTFSEKITGKFKNVDEVNNAIELVKNMISAMVQLAALDTDGDIYSGTFTTYSQGLNGFLQDLMTPLDAIDAKIPALDSIVSMMSYISNAMKEAGDIDAGNISVFQTLTQALANLSSISVEKTDFNSLGLNIAGGVQAGIEDGTSGVITAAVEMATAAYNAAKDALDVNSPSKVFAFIGHSMGEGMAVGADNSVGTVIDSVDSMTDEAITTAGNLMATISRIMAEETDANPTISPVLDLTNLRAGMNEFEQSLLGHGISIDPAASSSYAGRINGYSNSGYSGSTEKSVSFDGIYERFNQLNESIATLGTHISNMRLVLDSGVVAGGVTDGVDLNIGRKAFYASRRN